MPLSGSFWNYSDGATKTGLTFNSSAAVETIQLCKIRLQDAWSGKHLKEAVQWLNNKSGRLYGEKETRSNGGGAAVLKYRQIIILIDDDALGCPVEEDIFGRVNEENV
ncbi:hypothetical protein [Chitinophaga flava]|uniref:hypothetical protein n=1 Tax=Chitinophaga flava TaxID=2259036 RepID=UPI0011BDA5AB|nr:hypothetical protein [Chitinophaga flava]